MKEFYCFNDKKITPSIEPSGYQKDRRGRTIFFCKCGVCGTKKVIYVTTPFVESSEYNQNTRNRIKFLRRL